MILTYFGVAFGLVLIIEGLAYALAPSLVEKMLKAMATLSLTQRRWMGLLSVALGVFLVNLFLSVLH